MTNLTLNLNERSYDITIGKGLLKSVDKYMNLNRKIFIVTDDGVPSNYSIAVKEKCKDSKIFTVKSGEDSKSLSTLELLLKEMLDFGMSRKDAVVAVGGGVVGDLSGFLASVYMRGIDFYNIPTTFLSQVDSSIGGKTAVNLSGIKNIVGTFYQPKAVLIDTDTLKTLPMRQMSAGICEAIKMSMTSDAELFKIFENEGVTEENVETVIARSLAIKKQVVEADEKEGGLRKILNFGHTLGHGIEAVEELRGFYHGECVSIGMIPVSSQNVRDKLIPVLNKFGLPTNYLGDIDEALRFVSHDKKCAGGLVDVVFVDEIGSFRIEKISVAEFSAIVKKGFLM